MCGVCGLCVCVGRVCVCVCVWGCVCQVCQVCVCVSVLGVFEVCGMCMCLCVCVHPRTHTAESCKA